MSYHDDDPRYNLSKKIKAWAKRQYDRITRVTVNVAVRSKEAEKYLQYQISSRSNNLVTIEDANKDLVNEAASIARRLYLITQGLDAYLDTLERNVSDSDDFMAIGDEYMQSITSAVDKLLRDAVYLDLCIQTTRKKENGTS